MFLFSNNAKSSLAAPINTAATTLILSAGTGALFPNPGGGDLFALTLTDAATGQISEIMHCTARTGDTCTVVRAQEGTTALNWTTGDFANLVITAGTAAAFVQAGGSFGTMAEQNADDVDITGGSGDFTSLMVGGASVATNPTTTKGDIIVNAGSGVLARLGVGTDGQVLVSRATAGLGVDWEAAGSGGTNLQWVVVAGFTDVEIDAAVTAINASTVGGVVYLAPGVYNWTTTKTFTKPVTVIGCGCADALMIKAITEVTFNSATNDLFDFTVDPFQVRDVHLKNISGSTPTAGCGIHSTGNNGGHHLERVTTQGFWNNWQIDAQGNWYWNNCCSWGPVNYGAYIRNTFVPDGGDQGIVNCQFIAATYNSAAAIRWESGGGMRITNIKVNSASGFSHATGIDVSVAAGAVTSDFLLSNSSIENVAGSAIKFRNASGGTLPNAVIHGVQMANYGTSSPPVDIVASTSGTFDRLILDDLSFTNGSSSVAAINIQNVDNVAIGVCVRNNAHALLVSASGVTNFRNVNSRLGTMALTDAATISIDLANCENFLVTLGGNRTLANPTNATGGQMVNIRVHQDGTGSRTLAYGTKYKFPGGMAPVLSTAANAADMLSFQYDDSEDTYWLVAAKAFA